MGLISSLKNTEPDPLLLCKGTVLSAPEWFSSSLPLKTGLRTISQATVSSRFTLLHPKPNPLTSHHGQAVILGVCVSRLMILLKQGSEVLQRGALTCNRRQHRKGDTEPLQAAKRLTPLPSKELALQAYSVSRTVSLHARLHKLSKEVSVSCSVRAIHRDALFLQPVTLCLLSVTCP